MASYMIGTPQKFPQFPHEGANKKVKLSKTDTTNSFVWYHSDDHPYKDAVIQ